MKIKGRKLKYFDFYIDEKYTVWERHKYTVNAKNKKQALKLMKDEFDDVTFQQIGTLAEGVNFIQSETLYDTMEYMKPEDNDHNPTKELFEYPSNELIKVNYDK